MNRRMTLILIAAVVTVLPAVAVADVIISGSINVTGTANHPVFDVEAGSNYGAAHAAGSITWTASDSGSMGSLDLEGIATQSTTMLNVLDINMSSNVAAGTLTVTLTSSTLASNVYMLVSTSPVTSPGDVTSTGVVVGMNTNIGAGGTIFTGSVSSGTILYVSFYLPAGATGGSAVFGLSYTSG